MLLATIKYYYYWTPETNISYQMLILIDYCFLSADHNGEDNQSEENCCGSDSLDPGQVSAHMKDLHQGLGPT